MLEQLYVRGFRSVVACADQLQALSGGCIKAGQARVGHGIQLMGASLVCGILIMCVRIKSWNADGMHCVLILAHSLLRMRTVVRPYSGISSGARVCSKLFCIDHRECAC